MIDSGKYRELQRRLNMEVDEKRRIDLLSEMGSEMRNFDVEEASKFADECINRSKIVAYTPGIGKGLKLKGSCHWLKGEYDMGLEVLKVAQSIAMKSKDKPLEARVLYYMGNIYRDQGEFARVLACYKDALAIYEAINDTVSQSIILSSISNLLYDLGDFENALEYALKCLPIFEQSTNPANVVNVCNTLGNIFFKKSQFDEAMRYYKRIMDSTGTETIAYVMSESGVGKVYYKQGDFENARKHLSNSLQQAEHMANIEIQIICRFYLGRLYMDKGSYRQALQYLNNAYALAGEYNRRHDLMSIHEVLSALYDKMEDIPKAYFHLKSFENLKDEIFQQTIINELRNMQVNQQLELARKEKDVAERTAQLKHQFMANMSHEIRTPMNAIVGITRLLLGREILPAQQRYLRAIELSANNLLVIINDILDLSKIEAGKIVIENVDFTLSDILESVQEMFLMKAEEKKITFTVVIDERIPARLTGDPTRLNQILVNLAGNAVKFTDQGGVEIAATLRSKDNKYRIQFDVKDSGIGISAEHVEHIFDSFTQAGTDITRKFGGTGLGLSISRQLTSLMGGEISVKSELGKGTVFSVVLPFDEATDQIARNDEADFSPQDLEKLRRLKVLLAEDNEFNQMVAVETLQECLPGIEVDIAANGREATEKVAETPYDVVLMDVIMPLMDGVEATMAIRNRLSAPAKDTPIIAMTANVLQEDVVRYYEAGMNEYISKPFQVNDLITKINRLLGDDYVPVRERYRQPETNGTHQIAVKGALKNESEVVQKPVHPAKQVRHEAEKLAATQVQTVELQPEKQNEPAFDLPDLVTDRNFLRQFTGGNPDKMHKYISIFMDNAAKLLVNLDEAFVRRDFPAVKITAHSLKPQLSYMGIKEDVSHIQQLEHMAGGNPEEETMRKEIARVKAVCRKAMEELKPLL